MKMGLMIKKGLIRIDVRIPLLGPFASDIWQHLIIKSRLVRPNTRGLFLTLMLENMTVMPLLGFYRMDRSAQIAPMGWSESPAVSTCSVPPVQLTFVTSAATSFFPPTMGHITVGSELSSSSDLTNGSADIFPNNLPWWDMYHRPIDAIRRIITSISVEIIFVLLQSNLSLQTLKGD
jgi:hypothetical protein